MLKNDCKMESVSEYKVQGEVKGDYATWSVSDRYGVRTGCAIQETLEDTVKYFIEFCKTFQPDKVTIATSYNQDTFRKAVSSAVSCHIMFV